MTTPLARWQEKKQYLEYQLAITSDASQMYALRKQIQECETEIARLQSKATQEQAIMPFRQGAITSSTVAFIIIKELKQVGGIESIELLTKLHSIIKS